MIDTKPLKNESDKFQGPLRSVIEMSKNSMQNEEFVEFFIGLRKKAREMDAIQREDTR